MFGYVSCQAGARGGNEGNPGVRPGAPKGVTLGAAPPGSPVYCSAGWPVGSASIIGSKPHVERTRWMKQSPPLVGRSPKKGGSAFCDGAPLWVMLGQVR